MLARPPNGKESNFFTMAADAISGCETGLGTMTSHGTQFAIDELIGMMDFR
jgi:hypothetical protein